MMIVIKSLYIGFIFGLVAYGTYNLTNMAVLKGWSPTVVFVDMFWGGFLTAFSAGSGIFIAKKLIHSRTNKPFQHHILTVRLNFVSSEHCFIFFFKFIYFLITKLNNLFLSN